MVHRSGPRRRNCPLRVDETLLQCWRDNGTASPKPRGGSVSRLERHLKWILDLVAEQPNLTLDELVEASERMTLAWSPESIHDLSALRAYIAEHNPASAKRVALHILYCVEHLLSENPKLGAPGRVPGTRELVIPKTPYVVPYRVRGSTIEIVRVYHSSRRWPERL
jgi:toxin ParE1/3/4